jgi:hypothetical protein
MHASQGATGDRESSRDSFHHEVEAGPSNRSFGLLFTVVFALVGTTPWWSGGSVRLWAIVVAAVFGLAAIATPRALAPLNRLWLRLGLTMHRVINPVIMGAVFFLVVTPFGLVRQVMGKGITPRLHKDPRAATYWIDRTGHPAARMDQQF